MNCKNKQITEVKKDANELIEEILRKIPESKKMEVLRFVQGFEIGVSGNQAEKNRI